MLHYKDQQTILMREALRYWEYGPKEENSAST